MISKILNKILLHIGIFFHNKGYSLIQGAVSSLNNGTHPKHDIMQYHNFFVNSIGENDSVLDIGCGKGEVAFDVSKKARKVVGIDIVKKKIDGAVKTYQRPNLKFVYGDATAYDFKERFDAAVLSNSLEHIEDRVGLLKKVSTFCDKILVRVPLITRSWLPVYLKNSGYYYKLDRTHCIEYFEEEFFAEMESAGLKVDSYYIKWGEIYAQCVRL